MAEGCHASPVSAGSGAMALLGAWAALGGRPAPYGKGTERLLPGAARLPARAAWCLQELPSLLLPAALAALAARRPAPDAHRPHRPLLLALFCAHYFHRALIYPFFTKGRPFPVRVTISAALFCTINGLLQGYYLTYCAEYPDDWYTDIRFVAGIVMFFLGMGVNIHSDHLLRQLRKPGEITYKIPQGGMFAYVSGANFLGEIVEWMGFALATWSLPALAFAFFSLCFLGNRAYHHHRFYLEVFPNYPKSRKALIPFIF
ncbi:3-oxo-5-alpha-steroid 4-dehydrogenase 2 [Ornithorhynchus anatinus]|uniref:3-oxo-5-alpha-steroid 4-dehydrogenase n=1 Tax=Ornithorhynchus anatinus TaxID=9258 RepID=F6U0E0_ORNAN|nr:3-oxo-5-alpha-steroid 4-dehydrogenase 2 [Ornithorhynchus anatinus]